MRRPAAAWAAWGLTCALLLAHGAAAATMRITEWMYAGTNGEFVEFTNLGVEPVDMRRWSFDDDHRRVGRVDLSAFGVVQPGESVVITEAPTEAFRTAWRLSPKVRVIGGYTSTLGRADEINLYDHAGYRVDRLSFGDDTLGGPRTQGSSAWPAKFELIGVDNVQGWRLSAVRDAESSVRSQGGDIGSPGRTAHANIRGRLLDDSFPYVLNIDTDGGAAIVDKENYVPGRFVLRNGRGQVLHDVRTEIRGRGNSTWGMPKKPYRLRLDGSTELLDMPANRHWVLLANYADKTLMRNSLVLGLAARMGHNGWAPRSHHVELYLNGQYDGVYQLAEQVRIGSNRLDIPELDAEDTGADVITGGYLLEVDGRRGEDFCFDVVRGGFVVCASDPDSLLDAERAPQRAYITGYLSTLDEALFAEDFADPATGWRAYLDEASAVDYLILAELIKNVDGNFSYSPYLFKPRGGKLHIGPMWDFDIALGNVDYGDAPFLTDGWYLRGRWYGRLLEDTAFVQRVHARWAELVEQGVFDDLLLQIDRTARHLSSAQLRNFHRWPILATYVWPNRVVTGSYTGEVQALREWLEQRLAWMDGEWRDARVLPSNGPGLLGAYFANAELAGKPAFTGLESPNRSWPDLPGSGIGLDHWSARWSGELEAPSSGTYVFEIVSDDRTRVWLGGQLIVDAWGGPQPTTTYRSPPMVLTGGQRLDIVIEHADLAGASAIGLRWQLPGRVSFEQMTRLRMHPH